MGPRDSFPQRTPGAFPGGAARAGSIGQGQFESLCLSRSLSFLIVYLGGGKRVVISEDNFLIFPCELLSKGLI